MEGCSSQTTPRLFKEGGLRALAEVSSAAPHAVTSGLSRQRKEHCVLEDQSSAFLTASPDSPAEEAEGVANEGGGAEKKERAF